MLLSVAASVMVIFLIILWAIFLVFAILNRIRWIVICLFILGLTSVIIFVITDYELDTFCEKGSGKTVVNIRAFDLYTGIPLDSMHAAIRYGISGDIMIDSLVQTNQASLIFLVPENNCELYCADVYNALYEREIILKDTTQEFCLKKGFVNYVDVYLKPSMFLQLNLSRKTKTHDSSSVELFLGRGKNNSFQVYDSKDFDPSDSSWYHNVPFHYPYVYTKKADIETITSIIQLESKDSLDAYIIQKHNGVSDTTEFLRASKPFDTLIFNYRLK